MSDRYTHETFHPGLIPAGFSKEAKDTIGGAALMGWTVSIRVVPMPRIETKARPTESELMLRPGV